MVMCGCVVYSLLYGVMRVTDDLFAETLSLFCTSHCSRSVMYCCMCVAAVSCLGCCEIMVMSSAYVMV